jgi:hypothetical protein
VLPTALLYDVAKFTEYVTCYFLPSRVEDPPQYFLRTLEKIFTFVKGSQWMGKIKQMFKQPDNVSKIETCKQELRHTLEMFKVHKISLILY